MNANPLPPNPTPEDLLRALLSHFYDSGTNGLTWSYREDVSLRDLDPELDKAARPFFQPLD